MTTAKDIMHQGAHWIARGESLDRAAQLMRELDVGALPVADEDERLCGIITDRDIVTKCVAMGHDPSRCTAADVIEGTPRWVDAATEVDELVHDMADRRIKRMPVIENKRLVGMISEADLAQHLSDEQITTFTSAVYAS